MIRAAKLGVAALLAATLSVIAQSAGAESQTFFNTTPITFSGANTAGGGSAYPSTIQVAGLEGPVTDVDLHVNVIDMAVLADINLMLVSPSGEAEVAKAYACYSQSADGLQLTFDQQAPTPLPYGNCTDGSYRPTNTCGPSCPIFPGFPGAYSLNFDNFNGENANGSWRLYAYRTCSGGCPATGDKIAGGWSLSIDTGPVDVDLPAGGATSGPASPYPATRTVPLGTDQGLITDLDVRIDGIFHSYPDDMEIVLQKVDGPTVSLMSDACGGADATAYGWTWDDEAAGSMPDEGPCTSPSYRPSSYAGGDSLPAPAPAGPYATSLSAFDLVDPRGEWRMWIADDSAGDEGFFTNRFTLTYTTRPRAATTWSAAALSVAEGQTGTLTVTRSGATSYVTGYVTVTSSASAGDFQEISQTLAFAAGETSKTVQVVVTDDAAQEGAESFTVTLSGATGDARVVAPATATVTIPANDTPGDPDPTDPDTTAPDTRIVKAPKATTTKSRAKVKFVAGEPGVQFRCKVDKGAWKTCTSPLKLKNLAVGKHKVKVRAVDAAGNVESRPAVARWRVLR